MICAMAVGISISRRGKGGREGERKKNRAPPPVSPKRRRKERGGGFSLEEEGEGRREKFL